MLWEDGSLVCLRTNFQKVQLLLQRSCSSHTNSKFYSPYLSPNRRRPETTLSHPSHDMTQQDIGFLSLFSIKTSENLHTHTHTPCSHGDTLRGLHHRGHVFHLFRQLFCKGFPRIRHGIRQGSTGIDPGDGQRMRDQKQIALRVKHGKIEVGKPSIGILVLLTSPHLSGTHVYRRFWKRFLTQPSLPSCHKDKDGRSTAKIGTKMKRGAEHSKPRDIFLSISEEIPVCDVFVLPTHFRPHGLASVKFQGIASP